MLVEAEDRRARVNTYESSCTEVSNEAMILCRTRMLNIFRFLVDRIGMA